MAPRSSLLRVISNPNNPFHAEHIDWDGGAPEVALELFEDRSRSIIAKNDSPDIGFDHSINPYRGCYHGCAYCYARPSHQYLDFGAGTDFERKLTFKPDAAALLRAAFDRPSWRGEIIVFSGNTDCYQPLEQRMGLTRACLEVCLEYRNPVSIITKGALIERDAELLRSLSEAAFCSVRISIPFIDPDNARAIEPYVPTPQRRLQAIETLAKAGVSVGVNVAPIIPGLNDQEAPRVLEAARNAGATHYGMTLVRLPRPVDRVFEERVRASLPLRADRILSQIEDCRGGKRNESRFGHRMQGRGERWTAISELVRKTAARLGYEEPPSVPEPSPFRRPRVQSAQGSLFPELFGD